MMVCFLLIATGHVFGIAGKRLGGSIKWYALFFCVLNFLMVSLDRILYLHNHLRRFLSP